MEVAYLSLKLPLQRWSRDWTSLSLGIPKQYLRRILESVVPRKVEIRTAQHRALEKSDCVGAGSYSRLRKVVALGLAE